MTVLSRGREESHAHIWIALNLLGEPTARAHIAGKAYVVQRADPLDEAPLGPTPGTILDHNNRSMVIAVGDGALRVVTTETTPKESS